MLVLLALADFADDEGFAWPSQVTLGRKARVSERTVRDVLGRLVESGEIIVVRRGGRRGDQVVSSVYRVSLVTSRGESEWSRIPNRRESPVGSGSEPADTGSPTGSLLPANRQEDPSKSRTPPTPPRGDVSAVFDAWRSMLPEASASRVRLTGDRERKVRARLREGYAVADLIDAVRGMFASSWNVEHGQTDLCVAMKSGANVDRFVGYARDGAPVERRAGSGGAADALAARLAARAQGGSSLVSLLGVGSDG